MTVLSFGVCSRGSPFFSADEEADTEENNECERNENQTIAIEDAVYTHGKYV